MSFVPAHSPAPPGLSADISAETPADASADGAVTALSGKLTDERFRLLVEAVVDYGIFMLDPFGMVASWNSGAQMIKQYKASEVIGRHFSMFYQPDAAASGWPAEELRQARQRGRFEDEGWRIRKDGSRFWANVVITALYAPDGELTGFAKVTRDLTERRRQEEKLRESEQRFRLLIEGVKDYAIYMLDPKGIIESWNAGAQQLKGYTSAEAIGRHFSLFYTREDLAAGEPQAELERAVIHGRAEAEGWRLRKDGSAFWANVMISALYDGNGELRGFAKVTRDMTERRRLEDLESSGKRMNEFLAMLAHELRNPLAPIRNAVTILQLEPAQSPVVRNSRDIIDRQLTHMTRLVDDLLDAGRMSTGKITLQKEAIAYSQVVSRAVEAVRPVMDGRRHHLTVDLPDREVTVDADPTRLAQVLQNLLINAAKFTPDGGQIEISARVEGGRLKTEVRDNGIGLSRTSLASIFQLFSQGDSRTAARESGLGIGLTLARSLVELHGGTLDAHSAGPGRGSTFTFFLPGATSEPQHAGDAAESAWRVLVIDDNKDAADSLAEILRVMGWSVQLAYDGPRGLAIARDWTPHAVLLDIGMPDMTGYEVVRALRGLPGGPDMAIAAVTGYGTMDDRSRSKAETFDEHLTKPVDFTSLQRMLDAVQLKHSPG